MVKGAKYAIQNMPLWDIDYIELKLLKKQQLLKGHSDPPLSPWEQEVNLTTERPYPQEVERHLYHQTRRICVSKPRLFSANLLPQAQVSLSCQLFTNVLFLCLKGMKNACYGPFL